MFFLPWEATVGLSGSLKARSESPKGIATHYPSCLENVTEGYGENILVSYLSFSKRGFDGLFRCFTLKERQDKMRCDKGILATCIRNMLPLIPNQSGSEATVTTSKPEIADDVLT